MHAYVKASRVIVSSVEVINTRGGRGDGYCRERDRGG